MSLLKRNMPNETLTHYTFAQGISTEKEIVFHTVEGGKFILLGAYSTLISNGALYIDCEPVYDENSEWIYPLQSGNVLRIEQVYNAIKNDNVLRLE